MGIEKLDETYAEAFEGIFIRIILTAEDLETLKAAAEECTSTPSIVIGRVEGGIERYLSEKETPDGRNGVIIQFWGGLDPSRPIEDSVKKFEIELSYRIRQDILVKPFTSIFNALDNPIGQIDTMERIGHCGDGFEWEEDLNGRRIINVPIMVPDFRIERYLGYERGVMGGNFLYMCSTKEAVFKAGNRALDAMHEVPGIVTPFNICSAGSKPETKFPWIGPTTNEVYCPSLKDRIGDRSKVPENVEYIPEIVINGTTLSAVSKAMKAGIQSIWDMPEVIRISAGNYQGKLGKYKIELQRLFI
ncbi:MAG: formylmethanofuran--tetrahydromethanopterin N-formyltransferase [Candidatus Bathyarchaeota archaeon]|nr:formylmethanofuran--tetrahydromethanopterin N-formyltransferase [Candidatus Bathyarchaeota archaeon]